MSWNVLVTARAFWNSGQAAQALLEGAGCQIAPQSKVGPLPQEELIERLQGCDAAFAAVDPFNATVFAACPNLKIVSRCGVGIDSIDLNAATTAGVVISNAPGTMTEAVADYTFGLLLAAARGIVIGDSLMRAGGWTEFPGPLVYRKTLGLIGLGQIGQGVARRASGFAMRVLAFDPQLEEASKAGRLPADFPEVTFTDLDTLLKESDFVSVHAPSIPETQGLMNAARFAQMKSTAYLINTARGALIEENDLITALDTGQIAGAAIDVYRQEPLPADHPLRRVNKLVLTPHNAFNAHEAAVAMNLMAGQNIVDLLRGKHPAAVCNPDVWQSPALRT